ncbi:MAG: response regulator transcription factor [Propionibacteriaceae bacterium]|jgi:two-component system response regulator RegX3|nr:response regulator transcription factor [Propionibacteriaceae bacterium]
MSESERVDCLVVDDEAALSEATVEYFTMLGTSAAWVPDAAAALTFLANHDVGVLLLDINLEGESGFSLCRRLRGDTDIPILFISARGGDDDDILLALGVGGDDYIAKPYSLAVLHATVPGVLRRLGRASAPRPGAPGPTREADQFGFAGVTVRFDLERAFGPMGALPLTALEYSLLARLARSPGRPVPKRALFAAAWGHTQVSDGSLNVHIRRLRAKLAAAAPGSDACVKTMWGVGYSLDPPDPADAPDSGHPRGVSEPRPRGEGRA